MKKLFFTFSFILIANIACADSTTITSTYPAPIGIYQTIRLVPQPDGTMPTYCQNGDMYVDSQSDPYFCKDHVYQLISGITSWKRGTNPSGRPQIFTDPAKPDLKVGILTEDPQAKLHLQYEKLNTASKVNNEKADDSLRIEAKDPIINLAAEDASDSSGTIIFSELDKGSITNAWVLGRTASQSPTLKGAFYLSFLDNSPTDPNYYWWENYIMTFLKNGNVGIGAHNPSANSPETILHIKQVSPAIRLEDTNIDGQNWQLQVKDPELIISSGNNASYGSLPRLTFNQGGFVAVGSTDLSNYPSGVPGGYDETLPASDWKYDFKLQGGGELMLKSKSRSLTFDHQDDTKYDYSVGSYKDTFRILYKDPSDSTWYDGLFIDEDMEFGITPDKDASGARIVLDKLHLNKGNLLIRSAKPNHITLKYDTVDNFTIGPYDDNLLFKYFDSSGGTLLMGVRNTGQVFLGTDYYGTGSSYDLAIEGSLASNGTAITSDERYKTDIHPLSHSLDKIKKLRGVFFEWADNDKPKGEQIGVIAQEVEQVIPEVVATNDDGYKGVNYDQLIPVLIESIKELKQKNDGLRARAEALKKAKLSE